MWGGHKFDVIVSQLIFLLFLTYIYCAAVASSSVFSERKLSLESVDDFLKSSFVVIHYKCLCYLLDRISTKHPSFQLQSYFIIDITLQL